MSRRFFVQLAAILLLIPGAALSAPAQVLLKGKRWSHELDPASLRVVGRLPDQTILPISNATPASLRVADLRHDDRRASWRLSDAGMAVEMRIESDDALVVDFTADKPGKFTWPSLDGGTPPAAYILPLSEGSFVPADDGPWAEFLAGQGPFDTTSGLSMPFWGRVIGKSTVTYILTNPFNNELTFHHSGGKLGLALTHDFPPNAVERRFGYRVSLGDGSPVASAKIYRKYLVDSGQFVDLKSKIEKTPDAAKLLGAAHVYLWGDGIIARQDITDYRAFAAAIIEQSKANRPSVGKRLWALMEPEQRERLAALPGKEWVDPYDKVEIAGEMSRILELRDLYDAESWAGIELADESKTFLKADRSSLTGAEVSRLNSVLLHAAFPELLRPVERWGDGFSIDMIDAFAAAGLNRLWLGSPTWKGLSNHPDAVRKAVSSGYLIGPYDSFHSIHSPKESDTWETAQFDQQLYDTGAVVSADGARKKGFKQKGYLLSPIAARAFVEARIRRLMGDFRCNSWFVDCDAFGEWFDDYSPAHRATQQQDLSARLSRLDWINQTFHAVIGSEGGSALATPAIHFAHGVVTPVIGWGDPDLMQDRNSPYYLGGYYPPDGPAIFLKTVSMKDTDRRVYVDPQFRLPLYQTVFHDAVVATHQWGFGSLKFTDADHARELTELLYAVPPLYHLNSDQWKKQAKTITAHYQFFSPLHREAALLPMTDFSWLRADRLVQRTVFGDQIEVIANFSDEPISHGPTVIAGRSVLVRQLNGSNARVYQP